MPTLTLAEQETLDAIDVIAEPEPLTGEVQHVEHAGTHRHINKQSLEREDVKLGNILAQETGVQFRQVGGIGTLTTVTLRGASSAATDIFLDGILLNSAGNTSVDLSLLELLNLSSVDIYHGSAPAQLSSTNLGGAINLRSLSSGNNKPITSAAFTNGSFNTNRLQFSHRSSYNTWDVVAAATRETSDNNFSFLNDNATPFNLNDDAVETRNNAAVKKLSGLARIGKRWNPSSRSDLLIQVTGRDLGIPEFLNREENETSFDTDALEFHFTNRFDGIGDWNTSLSLFQHSQENHFLDRFDQVGLGEQDTRSESRTRGIRSYWERIGDSGTFSVNLSLRNETLDSTDDLADNQNFEVERNSIRSSLQYAYFTTNERLLITPSIRLHSVDDDFRGISSSMQNARSDTVVTPQLGVRYNASSELIVHSTIGLFAREPGFSELFGSRGLIIGNSNLDAEEGFNSELGVSYEPNNRLHFNANAFASFRDELIVLSFDSQGIGRSINAGRARVYGVELDSNWTINQQFKLRVNATYQITETIANNPAFDNLQLPGEARVSSHANLSYRKGNVRTFIETNYKSGFFFDKANLLPASSRILHNAGVEYQWRDFKFGLSANNLANDQVEDFNGFPRPGRSFFFSINYRL